MHLWHHHLPLENPFTNEGGLDAYYVFAFGEVGE